MIKPSDSEQSASIQLPSGSKQAMGQFNGIRVILLVLVLFILVASWTTWYSRSVSIPRYCDNPAQAIEYLHQVITKKEPAGNDSRRPYLIASKILYLLPQQSGEPLFTYLHRVRAKIESQCSTGVAR